MGGVAKDALIEVAPSEDPRICLAAIGVLGDVGTPKSFKVLRLGVASRNFQVREAAKNAIAKINTREDAAEKKKGE